MTAPVPDLLDSVLAAWPGELEFREGRFDAPVGYTLVINAPAIDMRGTVMARTREAITQFAMAYERMRNDLLHGPKRCICGAGYTDHEWGPKRGACPDRPGRYEPEETHHA
jgi:hypothetical protein